MDSERGWIELMKEFSVCVCVCVCKIFFCFVFHFLIQRNEKQKKNIFLNLKKKLIKQREIALNLRKKP